MDRLRSRTPRRAVGAACVDRSRPGRCDGNVPNKRKPSTPSTVDALIERARQLRRTSQNLIRQMKELASRIQEDKAVRADRKVRRPPNYL